jgi:hypothetical protein
VPATPEEVDDDSAGEAQRRRATVELVPPALDVRLPVLAGPLAPQQN